MIPSIRGRLRSLPLGDLVREARELVSQGAREICLVAQDLTAWGTDLYGNPSLAVLLSELGENLPETTWLRLLYLHPARLDNALLDRILGNARVLPYLDIPIQHASPGVLEAMNREIPPGRMREIFSRIREANPDFALRTTVMVGHPLEDEKAFETLLDFVSEVRFDRLGAFAYSPEEGTVSAALPGKVQARVKKRRLDKLMKLQEEISLARQARFEGKTLRILVESVDRNENLAFGRSYREAPEVDGVVEVRGGGRLIPGTFADVLILEGLEHDMIAEVQHDGV
jgi:ribosomal protein S12 methylthiotransferase